jgi:hypothetical protein
MLHLLYGVQELPGRTRARLGAFCHNRSLSGLYRNTLRQAKELFPVCFIGMIVTSSPACIRIRLLGNWAGGAVALVNGSSGYLRMNWMLRNPLHPASSADYG